MADRRKSPAPKNMGSRGLAFWNKVTGKYELRPDELVILEDACREMLLIDELQKAMRGESMIMSGSMGQPVVNPLVPELRQHRATLKALLASLKLPDDVSESDSGEPGEDVETVQQRKAANSRWSVAYGEVAG